MKLIMSPASPFARKARVTLRELALMDTVSEVAVATTAFNSDPAVIAANPTGRIPALVRDDGPALYDSRVITRFLNDTNDGALYPDSRIWEVLTLEATGDNIMDSAVSMTYEVRLRPEAEQSSDWIEAQWEKVSRAVATVNNRWMSHLNGPLDAAQISIACALSYLDLRHDARNWRQGNDALAAWHATFCARDSMLATKPE